MKSTFKKLEDIEERQDDYKAKPKSLVLDYTYITDTIVDALSNKQIQPLLSRT